MSKTTTRNIQVHGRIFRCDVRKNMDGYDYSVHGPISRIEGWTRGNLKDGLDEARRHAEEKIPK